MSKKIIHSLSFFILITLLNIPIIAHGQELQNSLSSPRATMKFFLNKMEEYKKGNDASLMNAINALDLSNLAETSRNDSGQLAAKRLIRTLDKIERVKVTKIPLNPKNNIWFFRQENVLIDGSLKSVEIAIFKNKNNLWLFTPKTVSSIKHYAKYLQDKKTVAGISELTTWQTPIKRLMPEWTEKKFFILINGQWLALILIVLLAYIAEKLVKSYYFSASMRILKRFEIFKVAADREKNLAGPLGVIVFTSIWIVAIRPLELPDNILSIFLRLGYIALSVAAVVLAYHIVDVISIYFEDLANKSENKFDEILVPLLRKTAKFVVIAIGIIFIGDSLTMDMKSILTGLGIGGLAFALAAKDALSNLFGSLTVLLDRPFRIGDYILINDIEGIVEEVGLRSTRIRTFYDSLITVPNGLLTNVNINNYGQRSYRRYRTIIGLQYDTPPEKIEAFCEGIKEIILKNPLTKKSNFHVCFNEMGDFALHVLLYVFWQVPDWTRELEERHKLLMDILRLGNNMDIRFAFPTQTLHLFKENHKAYENIPESQSPQEHGLAHANKLKTE